MRAAGIDIGLRTVKLALVETAGLVLTRKALNSHDPIEKVKELIHGVEYDSIIATGYGRHLVKGPARMRGNQRNKGLRPGCRLFPAVQMILDIGGQDTKAISLTQGGEIHNSR